MTTARLFVAALLLAATPLFAEDAPAPAIEAKPEAAAVKETPAPPAEVKTEPPAPAPKPAKPAEAPKAPEAFKPAGAAAPYQTVADGYVEGSAKFVQWLKESSSQAKDLADRETALKKDIQDKEAESTRLKLDNSKTAKQQLKELAQQTKQLWRDLDKLDSEKSALKRTLSRSAANKVRELNADINERLSQAQQAE